MTLSLFDNKNLNNLKSLVELKSGLKVLQYNDCKNLSAILKKERISISPLTLARIYRIQKGTNRPYISTLDLMASFIGYNSFSVFCSEYNNEKPPVLYKPTFSFGEYSHLAFELAFQEEDWRMVKILLDSKNPEIEDFDFPMYLGNAVRNHPSRNEFLKALTEVEVGRIFYYERFVDEDDQDDYYSNALSDFYLKYRTDSGSQVFKNCFQLSKKIYKQQAFDNKLWSEIENTPILISNFHFHQISRFYETKILFAGIQSASFSKVEKYIEELLGILNNFENTEKCWLLARPIKALAHVKLLEKAIKINGFRDAILETYFSMQNRVNTIGELIIQFIVHYFCFSENSLPVPKALANNPFNESQSRLAIESATSLIYSNASVKKLILKNLEPFAKRTGNTWVLNAIK